MAATAPLLVWDFGWSGLVRCVDTTKPPLMGELEVRLCAEAERRGWVGGSGVDAITFTNATPPFGAVEWRTGETTEAGRWVCGFGIDGSAPALADVAAVFDDAASGGVLVVVASSLLQSGKRRTGEGEKDGKLPPPRSEGERAW